MKKDNKKAENVCPQGLALLMQRHVLCFTTIEESAQYCKRKNEHPFGLDLPATNRGPDIYFVGANATDLSVAVFLANIRYWAGYTDQMIVTKLRIINTPFRCPSADGQHHVFFEIWTGTRVTISGETTDSSGAGNVARLKLESVFAVLAMVYKLSLVNNP